MFEPLWLIPALPLAGFFVLTVAGSRLSRPLTSIIGVGSVALATLAAFYVGVHFLWSPPPGGRFVQTLWSWISVGELQANVSLYLDPLSLAMILIVTFVGFLIHYYSTDFMAEDENYTRFFAYMNLFVAAMLVLVLADNLLLLLLGWEGVGLCSYLLIGFWYDNPDNGKAAVKAFVVTRVGDAAFLIGIFIIFFGTHTLNMQLVMERAAVQWQPGSSIAVATAWLLLIGAMGKSAQVPLQVWLPDAMAGPTPVSALIHAATMVTAGVYLVARMNGIFILAPSVQFVIAIIGVVTILLAGFSALVQEELKRVLAYSTISQIGYMFLALGVGAWSAAIFHLLSHAFFKSLLFLCAGVIILSLDHEKNMLRMGGLRRRLPIVFITFLAGAMANAGLPPTGGFASKGLILYRTWLMPGGGHLLWVGALTGVFITSLYVFRMVFLTFFGEINREPTRREGVCMGMTLVVLAAFCFLVGALDWPKVFGGLPFLTDFLRTAMHPLPSHAGSPAEEALLEVIATVVGLFGVALAWLLFFERPAILRSIDSSRPVTLLRRLWFSDWGFDWLYGHLFVAPFVQSARKNRRDFIDRFYDGVSRVMTDLHGLLSLTESGNLRWYAMSILLGAIAFMAVIIFL